jgi:hypothetical protein
MSPNLDPEQEISYLEKIGGGGGEGREIDRLGNVKLGPAAGNFLSGKRDGEREREIG